MSVTRITVEERTPEAKGREVTAQIGSEGDGDLCTVEISGEDLVGGPVVALVDRETMVMLARAILAVAGE